MGQFSKDMVAFLEGRGFRQYPTNETHCVALQRRLDEGEFQGAPGCNLNDWKLFVNVTVHEFPLSTNSMNGVMNGIVISLTAQDTEELTFKIQHYSSRYEGTVEEHTSHFDKTCRRLVRAWKAINTSEQEPERPIAPDELIMGSRWMVQYDHPTAQAEVELDEPPVAGFSTVHVRVVDPVPPGFARSGFVLIDALRRK